LTAGIAGQFLSGAARFRAATGARHEPISDKSSDDYHVRHSDRALSCCNTRRSSDEQRQAFEEAQQVDPDEPGLKRSLVHRSGVAEQSGLVEQSKLAEQQVLHSDRQDLLPGNRLRDLAASDRRRSRPKGYRPRALRRSFWQRPFSRR
jgi:hypothetical protein